MLRFWSNKDEEILTSQTEFLEKMAAIQQKIEIHVRENFDELSNSKLYKLLNGLVHQADKLADVPEWVSCQKTKEEKVSPWNEPSSALGASDKVPIF